MTVLSTTPPYSQYTGTGAQTYYEYGFEWDGNSPVFVEVNGVPVSYTAQANGVVLDNAPPLGASVVIFRQTDITQERDFTAFDSFNAGWTEDALDKLILLKQEAAAYRAQTNLFTDQPVWYTDIVSTNGPDPRIYLWNEGFAGVFAGEVTMSMPNAGTYVEKPEDFVYFQYGDVEILTEELTTTLYPIEVEEKLAFTCDLSGGSMREIAQDAMDLSTSTFLSASKATLLLDIPLKEDAMDLATSTFLSASKTTLLVEIPLKEDAMDLATSTFLYASKELKLVTAYAPAEKLALTCDLNPANCSMTPV